MVLEPTFRKEETDKERTVIFDEIESYNDSPSELIYDDFESLVFNGHPLAMPILGTRKTLRRISSKPDYALNWMRKHYRPERMVVFCQGNIRPERFFRLAEKEFGHLKSTLIPTVTRQSPDGQPTDNYAATYTRHTHQVHAMLGGKAYPLGHERQLAMFLLNNILGGGSLNSRLNLSLREKRGLVYTVESTYTPLSDSGYWCAYWACDPEQYDYCLGLVRDELHKLCSTPLSKSGLQKAIQQLRGQMAISAQNQENSALSMAKSMLYYGHVPHWTDTFKKIESISTSQLQNVANETYSPEKLYTLTYK
jgi:predicted Zn-dependent peptidase